MTKLETILYDNNVVPDEGYGSLEVHNYIRYDLGETSILMANPLEWDVTCAYHFPISKFNTYLFTKLLITQYSFIKLAYPPNFSYLFKLLNPIDPYEIFKSPMGGSLANENNFIGNLCRFLNPLQDIGEVYELV